MVLATHALVGAILSQSLRGRPVLGFLIAFLSHFLLDSIPHWDYKLMSRKIDESDPLNLNMISGRNFIFDLSKIGLDFMIGAGLSFLLFYFLGNISLLQILAGVFGATFPDFLQFIYMKAKVRPVISLQKFHKWIHASYKMKERYILGSFLQATLVLILTFVFRYFSLI